VVGRGRLWPGLDAHQCRRVRGRGHEDRMNTALGWWLITTRESDGACAFGIG
jgi:hypothetical protein